MSGEKGAEYFLEKFSDLEAVSRYTDGPRRFVPGLVDLYRMTGLLLAEHAPENANVLVLGAGGGLETKALAEAHTGWHFTGVDPAAPMLALAAQTLGPLASRAEFVHGYIEDAPDGPFDAATCLLTLHFLDAEGRCRTLKEIRKRMKQGAPLVVAHGSFPQAESERRLWLSRYEAFAVSSGTPPEDARMAREAVDASVHMLAPEQDEAVFREAGFTDASLFFAAFTWRGWIMHA